MANNTRQLIVEKSRSLFISQGYSATSLRQIADECDIEMGNLYYYFKKKEDLFMIFHNEFYTDFTKRLQKNLESTDNPWCDYIVMEYCFLYKCAFDLTYRKLFLEAINIPSLRREYIMNHHEKFLTFISKKQLDIDARDIYMSTVIISAAEFQLMEFYAERSIEMDFDYAFAYVFDLRMKLLGVPAAERKQYIDKGFAISKEIVQEYR